MRLTALTACAVAMLALPVGAQTIDRIKENTELRIGYRSDAAPLSFADEQGIPSGYSPLLCAELAQGIANALELDNMKVNFVTVSAEDRFDKVAAGEIDILCGAASITLSRREIVDFSIPTYVDGTAIMIPVDAPGQFTDLAGKTVGVRNNTTTQQALENTLNRSNLDTEVVSFDSHDLGLDAMKSGALDAYFADQSILLYLYSTSGMQDQFKLSNQVLTVEKQGLAMQRGDSDFRLLVDTILSELYKNGTVERLFSVVVPGASPGQAMRSLYQIAPTLP